MVARAHQTPPPGARGYVPARVFQGRITIITLFHRRQTSFNLHATDEFRPTNRELRGWNKWRYFEIAGEKVVEIRRLNVDDV